MKNKRLSIYEECLQKGISRRDFLKFCTTVAALIQWCGTSSKSTGNKAETSGYLASSAGMHLL